MKRKTWIGWAIAVLAFILLYGVAVSSLRAQMEAALSSACGRPVMVESAQVILPPGIRLSGITVAARGQEPASPLSIGQIQTRLALTHLLQGQRGLELEVRQPRLNLTWTPQARALFSFASLKGTSASFPLPLARLHLWEGELLLVDETVIPAVEWNVRHLEGEFAATAPGSHRFHFTADLTRSTGEGLGHLEVEGTWMTGGPLDGRITLQHGDLHLLAPYLRKVLGTAVLKGRAELKTRLTLHEGVVMAYNDVTAEGLSFPAGAVTTLEMEGNRVIELLQDKEGKVHLGFTVSGPLGKRLNWSDLATSALREATRQALARGIQNVLKETEKIRPSEEILRDQYDSR